MAGAVTWGDENAGWSRRAWSPLTHWRVSARIGVWLLGPVGPEIVALSTNPSFSCARSLLDGPT
jgi:hypothetical protein